MSWNNFVNSLTGGVPHSDKKFLGLKIALVGYLIAMAGALLLFSGFNEPGQLVAYLGTAVSVVGIVAQAAIILFRLK